MLTFTPSGEYLQKQSAYLLQIWNTTKQQLQLIENSISGTITWAIPAIFETKLFSTITKMGQLHPEINFIFNSEDPLLILQTIKNNRADIGIVFSYQLDELDQNIEYRYLFKDSFCAIVNAQHPLASRESVQTLTRKSSHCKNSLILITIKFIRQTDWMNYFFRLPSTREYPFFPKGLFRGAILILRHCQSAISKIPIIPASSGTKRIRIRSFLL